MIAGEVSDQQRYQELFSSLGIDDVADHYEVVSQCYRDNWDYITHRLKSTNKKLLMALDANPFDAECYYRHSTFHPRLKVLSANLHDLWQQKGLVYFPHFFLTQLRERDLSVAERKYRFGFLSRQPRPHRLYLLQKIRPYIRDHDCVAVHANNISDWLDTSLYGEALYDDLPFYTSNAKDAYYIDHFQKDFFSAGDHSNQHAAYQSCFYITGESNDAADMVFLSEKTWKSFRSRCLPLNYGNLGACTLLAKLGFNLAHDIEGTCVRKAQWIMTLMKNWDFDFCRKFYQRNINIIDNNFDRFYSGKLRQFFADSVRQQLGF